MDRIRHILQLARRRDAFASIVSALSWGLLAAAMVAIGAVGVVKLVPSARFAVESVVDATTGVAVNAPKASSIWTANELTLAVLCASVAALLLTTMLLYLVHRHAAPSEAAIALRVDERLKLDERLTSALAFEHATDAYARAAVADAVDAASKPDIATRVRVAFPIPLAPRGYWSLAALAAAMSVQMFVPRYPWNLGDGDGAQLVADNGNGVLSGSWRQDDNKIIKVAEDGKVRS